MDYELEILSGALLVVITFGGGAIAILAKYLANKQEIIDVIPNNKDIHLVIIAAQENMKYSTDLKAIDGFSSLEKEITYLRSDLISKNQPWFIEGESILNKIKEISEEYALNWNQSKSLIADRNTSVSYVNNYKNMAKSVKNMQNLLKEIRERHLNVLENKLEENQKSTANKQQENLQEIPENCQRIINSIQKHIDRGITKGSENITEDLLILKGIQAEYLPDTISAYQSADGYETCDTIFKEQLQKLDKEAEASAERILGNPLTELKRNGRFLNNKFGSN